MRNLTFLKRVGHFLNLEIWFNFIINSKLAFLKLNCWHFDYIIYYLIHLLRVYFIASFILFKIFELNSYLSIFIILILIKLKLIIAKNNNAPIFFLWNNCWSLFLITSINFLNFQFLILIIHFHSEWKNGANA